MKKEANKKRIKWNEPHNDGMFHHNAISLPGRGLSTERLVRKSIKQVAVGT